MDSNGTYLQWENVGQSDSIGTFIGLAAGTYYVKIVAGNYNSSYKLTINTCNSSNQGSTSLWYYDGGGDDYGDPNYPMNMATQPTGYVSDKTDCDDTNASIHPGAIEIAGDGID